MQAKVSIVMPCYNKVEYIAEMFESVLAQNWDNIELILVNDGSTDGTREVISEYVPKFLARGFEPVVVDQKNAGVCAAAKAGLFRVSGEYVCMVDADDELDSDYIRIMAVWLTEHSECDFCVCDAVLYSGGGNDKVFKPFTPRGPEESDPAYLERYLLLSLRTEVWVYMVRAGYLKKCGLPESYYTATSGSHEPGFAIPLLAYGGRYKYFPMPLYRFNQSGVGHSRPQELSRKLNFAREYLHLCKIAVDRLPETVASSVYKARLKCQAELAKYILAIWYTEGLPDERRQAEQDFAKKINACFTPSPGITNIEPGEIYALLRAVKDCILGAENKNIPQEPAGRVIAWGALGKRGQWLLPKLKGTPVQPAELWDKTGDGIAVKKPVPESLTTDDLVLVLPKGETADRICALLGPVNCGVMRSDDLITVADKLKNWRFYNGSLAFKPEGAMYAAQGQHGNTVLQQSRIYRGNV